MSNTANKEEKLIEEDTKINLKKPFNSVNVILDKEFIHLHVALFLIYLYLKSHLLNLFVLVNYLIKRAYIIVWHELSMDPAVRTSPYSEPPPNEVELTSSEKLAIRILRIGFILVHFGALVGLVYCLIGRVKLYTILYTIALVILSNIGMSTGAHRFWSHRSFKATWQLRTILMVLQTMCVQHTIYYWTQMHRMHHRYVDTEADPINSSRGFFYSHIGWIVTYPRPEVISHMEKIDMSDIENDKVAVFQRKYYTQLVILVAILIPSLIPWYFWGESWLNSFLVAVLLRYILTLNALCLTNSLAHKWGMKPYDRNMNATDITLLSLFTSGEGWHNYHHAFPWDYRSSEVWDYKINFSIVFVDLFARIGWAYDLKTASNDIVRMRVKRTGDGTEHASDWIGWLNELKLSRIDKCPNSINHIWGWDDDKMSEVDRKLVEIINKKSS